MKIINLTPHDVKFINEDGEEQVFATSGIVARVEQFLFSVEDSKYNLKTQIMGGVDGLPGVDKDTVYIVSSMVREAEPKREDLWSPTSFFRDEEGNIIGCTAFIRN